MVSWGFVVWNVRSQASFQWRISAYACFINSEGPVLTGTCLVLLANKVFIVIVTEHRSFQKAYYKLNS